MDRVHRGRTGGAVELRATLADSPKSGDVAGSLVFNDTTALLQKMS
jgi:hypothetical protein